MSGPKEQGRPAGNRAASNSSERGSSLPLGAAVVAAVGPLTWQRAALRSGRLSAPAVAVVAALVTIAPGRPGDFYGSVPSLMALSGLGERSVRSALVVLRRLGFLAQVKRGGWRNDRAEASTWRLIVPEVAPDADSESTNTRSERAGRAGSEPVDASASARPNRHQSVSEPAPEACPRAEFYQERSQHPLGALGTESPAEFAAGDSTDTPSPMAEPSGRRSWRDLVKAEAVN